MKNIIFYISGQWGFGHFQYHSQSHAFFPSLHFDEFASSIVGAILAATGWVNLSFHESINSEKRIRWRLSFVHRSFWTHAWRYVTWILSSYSLIFKPFCITSSTWILTFHLYIVILRETKGKKLNLRQFRRDVLSILVYFLQP